MNSLMEDFCLRKPGSLDPLSLKLWEQEAQILQVGHQ